MEMKNPITQPLIALRLYVALSMFVSYLIIGLEANTLAHRIIIQDTEGGPVLIMLSFILSTIAVVDTVVNDIMPERYVLIRTKKLRHIGFMSLALLAGAQAYFILKSYGPTTIVARYILDSIGATSVAFLGLKELLPFPHYDRRQHRV